MEIFTVGGAVRDELLGLPVKDRDFVVVGATPDELTARGFRAVGRDFPVFLHPQTQEEYALARTERKTAPGYKGFVFHADREVTLEQDLCRRDLTINAMARAADGRLIDPHGGLADLRAGILRHVGAAFSEDPVRILRLARFAARFENFRVAPETLALCRAMVAAGEIEALVPERVWQELARGLESSAPVRMFEVLEGCGALACLLPELVGCAGSPQGFAALGRAARAGYGLAVRWAALWAPACAGGADGAAAVAGRLRVPSDCRELGVLAAAEAAGLGACGAAGAMALMDLFERCDALRRPQRFARLLEVAGCVGAEPAALARVQAGHAAALRVDAGAIARAAPRPEEIPGRIREGRIAAIAGAQR